MANLNVQALGITNSHTRITVTQELHRRRRSRFTVSRDYTQDAKDSDLLARIVERLQRPDSGVGEIVVADRYTLDVTHVTARTWRNILGLILEATGLPSDHPVRYREGMLPG